MRSEKKHCTHPSSPKRTRRKKKKRPLLARSKQKEKNKQTLSSSSSFARSPFGSPTALIVPFAVKRILTFWFWLLFSPLDHLEAEVGGGSQIGKAKRFLFFKGILQNKMERSSRGGIASDSQALLALNPPRKGKNPSHFFLLPFGLNQTRLTAFVCLTSAMLISTSKLPPAAAVRPWDL